MHGGAYVPLTLYPEDAITVTKGEPSAWALKTTRRSTCASCGTRMFASPGGFHAVTGLLLPEGTFAPSMHIFCAEAVLPINDDLPHYVGLPAAFGGSDDVVDW